MAGGAHAPPHPSNSCIHCRKSLALPVLPPWLGCSPLSGSNGDAVNRSEAHALPILTELLPERHIQNYSRCTFLLVSGVFRDNQSGTYLGRMPRLFFHDISVERQFRFRNA